MSYPCPRARDRSAIGCPSFIAGATASGWESSIGRFSPADAVSGRWPRTVRMNDPHVRLLPRGYRGRRRHSDRAEDATERSQSKTSTTRSASMARSTSIAGHSRVNSSMVLSILMVRLPAVVSDWNDLVVSRYTPSKALAREPEVGSSPMIRRGRSGPGRPG